LYKPTAGDVRRMSDVRAVLYCGLHLEGKMDEVFEQMGRRGVPTVAVAECVPEQELITVEDAPGVCDPHVWFDPQLWRYAVGCVGEALTDLDRDHADDFAARADAYLNELGILGAWVPDRIAEVPVSRRVLVTAHDAFCYFGRAFGVEVRGLLVVSMASKAGTADVQQSAGIIAERRVAAIFVESSVSPRYVESLQQAVSARGFEVVIGGSLYCDALGEADGPAATYLGTVRSNVDTIVDGVLAGE